MNNTLLEKKCQFCEKTHDDGVVCPEKKRFNEPLFSPSVSEEQKRIYAKEKQPMQTSVSEQKECKCVNFHNCGKKSRFVVGEPQPLQQCKCDCHKTGAVYCSKCLNVHQKKIELFTCDKCDMPQPHQHGELLQDKEGWEKRFRNLMGKIAVESGNFDDAMDEGIEFISKQIQLAVLEERERAKTEIEKEKYITKGSKGEDWQIKHAFNQGINTALSILLKK